MKSSAHIELSGVTVFEPMILKEPDIVEPGDVEDAVGVPLHPTRKMANSSVAARVISQIFLDVCKLFSPLIFLYRWFRSASDHLLLEYNGDFNGSLTHC
jgi:hypothetical protein